MPALPDLPTAAHADVDSMLSRKFGREVANYFSGSPLNRLSFLRSDPKFLTAAVSHPSTRFLLLRDLAPLAHSESSLAWAQHSDVEQLLTPYEYGEKEAATAYDSRTPKPAQLVFLGVDETTSQPEAATSAEKDGSTASPFSWKIYKGQPYFALDVTPHGAYQSAAEALIKSKTDAGLKFLEGRTHMGLHAREAAIFAVARSVMDWNLRNPFCGGCGQVTISVNGGFKRACPATDAALAASERETAAVGTATSAAATSGGSGGQASAVSGSGGFGGKQDPRNATTVASSSDQPGARAACATRGRISNLSFPRTDPTIIVAVLSPDGQRILMGRQRTWPKYWYSTLAGFVEPGESVEEAVRREVWEESGIALGRVQVHSTQPWPYPASLMLGCVAQALPGHEKVSLEYDPELEDARWFEIAEVREALTVGVGSLDETERRNAGYVEGNLRLPPKMAIANQLLTAVVDGGFAGAVGKL